MVTFLKSGAHSIVEGMIRISPDCIWASGYLHEKNIILGNNISIKTLPQLDIHHHNVKAGHGATIDSINDRSLFYMMSKGITKKDATKLILNGVIETLFEWYPQDHTISELKQNLLDTVVAD
jgi:Fe-S cluster assembly protein SufD